jgi:hypothetical protein
MSEITLENRMIIASNLTVAAVIRDATMAMKSGPNGADSRDMVIEIFTAILSNLEKQSDMTAQSTQGE